MSGGLDSSSVVSFAVKSLKRKINEYIHLVIFRQMILENLHENRFADERPYIKSIVDYVGNINNHYLDFEGKEYANRSR